MFRELLAGPRLKQAGGSRPQPKLDLVNIAFIGLGSMGSPMARNLIKAGHQLAVYNRTRSRAEEMETEGARVASAPHEAVEGAEVLVTMLADDQAVRSILFEPGNAIEHLPPGALHISMSTISVALSRALTAAHKQREQHYLAATVLGRPDAAAAGQLFVIAAGAPGQIQKAQPLLDVMGQKTFVAGEDPAAANVLKLATNFLITTVIESLAEAFALVRKQGLDPKAYLDFLTGSLFSAPVYKNYGALVAENKFDQVGFKLPLGLKDNRLVAAAAEEVGVPMPLASLIHDRFVAAMAGGLEQADWAAFARIAYQQAGLRQAA
jgi:3-hydroxyisobutyrate dehydrogenase-like beta-hydroxyacid dehydrogenase